MTSHVFLAMQPFMNRHELALHELIHELGGVHGYCLLCCRGWS